MGSKKCIKAHEKGYVKVPIVGRPGREENSYSTLPVKSSPCSGEGLLNMYHHDAQGTNLILYWNRLRCKPWLKELAVVKSVEMADLTTWWLIGNNTKKVATVSIFLCSGLCTGRFDLGGRGSGLGTGFVVGMILY